MRYCSGCGGEYMLWEWWVWNRIENEDITPPGWSCHCTRSFNGLVSMRGNMGVWDRKNWRMSTMVTLESVAAFKVVLRL